MQFYENIENIIKWMLFLEFYIGLLVGFLQFGI